MKHQILFVGSRALHYLQSDRTDYGIDEANIGDIDIICSMEAALALFESMKKSRTYPNTLKFFPISANKIFTNMVLSQRLYPTEIEIAWEGSTAHEFMQIVLKDPNTTKEVAYRNQEFEYIFPTLPALYAMKMSHRFLRNSPHFNKTREHIVQMRNLLQQANESIEINDQYKNWFVRREEETYNYPHPKLNQNKEDFFNTEGVKYTYDHDSLHRAVAWDGEPAYLAAIQDGAEVMMDEEKFLEFSDRRKLLTVVEEASVLALERCLVPFPGMKEEWAFKKALEKICTSIASGWWREYAWENYDAALELYRSGYRWRGRNLGRERKPLDEYLQDGLANGTVKVL